MKKNFRFKFISAGLPLILFFVAATPLVADPSAQNQKSGISREMEQSIKSYNEGEDNAAMDGFIGILVKGSPAEKALANDYITKITLRMNTGVTTIKDADNEIGDVNTIKTADQPGSARDTSTGGVSVQDDMKSRQQDAMAKKIATQIAQMRRDLLLQLGRSDAVKVYMGDAMPKAITLNTNFFFAGETSFRPGTEKILSTIAGLIFTLGRSNCIILPEGAAAGDVKIKNIRRVLAINSYFESRGVSKSKLDLNLTGSDALFPKELNNMNGIIILFDYEREPRLKDLEDIQTKGPKVSLGVYPTAIAVHNNEGAVVEFSAFESPIGQPTWSFQVFRILKDGSRLQLQEISGNGAQYNQSFWNGRSKFFGAAYPSGKYMFTVTAKDIEGRETSLSRLLVIRPTPEEEKAIAANPALAKAQEKDPLTSSSPNARKLKPGAGGVSGQTLTGPSALKKGGILRKGAKKTSGANIKTKQNKASAKSRGAASGAQSESDTIPVTDGKPSAEEAPADLSGRVSYKIYFKENTATITPNSEKKLGQVAETLGYYPMASIALTGYAYSGESNAEAMAESRVNYVATRLAEKYKIDQSRMNVKSRVSETPKSAVEIQMSGNE